MFMIGGMGGNMPQPDYTVHLALFVDAENGDVLRLAAKVYEKNPMMGNVAIQVAGGAARGGRGDEEEGDDEKDEKNEKKEGAAADGKPAWKKGLPVKKPAKEESVMTFRADFQKLGLAEAPALDDKAKALLRLR